jgi:DNA ligase-1
LLGLKGGQLLEEVIRIFNEIRLTSSKNEKEAIINANSGNELFKECLKFLLDSQIVTGISKAKLNKQVKIKGEIVSIIEEWGDCMDYLKNNNTGTDKDIKTLQYFIDTQLDKNNDFYKQMITKSLKLGCDCKTVNKAIPGLITTWDVQLGSGYDKLKLKKNEWFSLSRKLNGNRCSHVDGRLLSRQGKEFTGMQHILKDIGISGLDNYFIDGELIRKNIDSVPDGENFRVGTGIINSDLETKEEIKLVIFDMFPKERLHSKTSLHTYKTRKNQLDSLRYTIKDLNLLNIEVVEMVYEGTDTSKIDEWLQYSVDHDWEGLMLNKDTRYECKRTTNLIKIKRFYTMDLEVIDVQEGDGRLSGTLGALVVKYKDNTVNVGSGYSDEQRAQIWNNHEDMIGKIIEVKYKEVTKDKKTGLESLQFPVFVQIREDKSEASYN